MPPIISSSLTPTGGKDWNNQLFDCFGMPGGAGLCCYVLICPCCAAGDVSIFVHENHCATCCLLPCLLGWSCGWANNRARLSEKFGIVDPYAKTPLGCCVPVSLYLCGCRECAELHAPCLILAPVLNTLPFFFSFLTLTTLLSSPWNVCRHLHAGARAESHKGGAVEWGHERRDLFFA